MSMLFCYQKTKRKRRKNCKFFCFHTFQVSKKSCCFFPPKSFFLSLQVKMFSLVCPLHELDCLFSFVRKPPTLSRFTLSKSSGLPSCAHFCLDKKKRGENEAAFFFCLHNVFQASLMKFFQLAFVAARPRSEKKT